MSLYFGVLFEEFLKLIFCKVFGDISNIVSQSLYSICVFIFCFNSENVRDLVSDGEVVVLFVCEFVIVVFIIVIVLFLIVVVVIFNAVVFIVTFVLVYTIFEVFVSVFSRIFVNDIIVVVFLNVLRFCSAVSSPSAPSPDVVKDSAKVNWFTCSCCKNITC